MIWKWMKVTVIVVLWEISKRLEILLKCSLILRSVYTVSYMNTFLNCQFMPVFFSSLAINSNLSSSIHCFWLSKLQKNKKKSWRCIWTRILRWGVYRIQAKRNCERKFWRETSKIKISCKQMIVSQF